MPVAESGPKYPIPWIATYFITALIPIVGSFVMVWYVNLPASKFDYSDPDMVFLERIAVSASPRSGDFSELNGGDWQTLCLVGWQGGLNGALDRASIETARAGAITAAHAGVAQDVEKTEFVLIYVDGEGNAKAVHHPHGFAFAQDGAAVCATNGEAVLALPVVAR